MKIWILLEEFDLSAHVQKKAENWVKKLLCLCLGSALPVHTEQEIWKIRFWIGALI